MVRVEAGFIPTEISPAIHFPPRLSLWYVYTMNTTTKAPVLPFILIATENGKVRRIAGFSEAHLAGRAARDLQDGLAYDTAVRYSYLDERTV